MGRVFTLSGASGVGKTTFLEILFASPTRPSRLRLLPRFTNRPERKGERGGFEYQFTSYEGMLQKTFANDFAYVERWGDYYSGIERADIDQALEGTGDVIVLTSVPGAAKLQVEYGAGVIPLYLWPGSRHSLRNPSCLKADNPDIREIKRRIVKKLSEDGFSEFEIESLRNDEFLEKRMVDNYMDIAAANGRLRSGHTINVIQDPADEPERAVESFTRLYNSAPLTRSDSIAHAGRQCFVLMPFRDELNPVFEDHILPTCEGLGLHVSRADRIFSTRPIMDDVLQAVRESHFIIADLTDSNPNVFYEVGLCHALGKDVILITQLPDAPFDLRHIRRIFYEYTPRGMTQLSDRLSRTIESALSDARF